MSDSRAPQIENAAPVLPHDSSTEKDLLGGLAVDPARFEDISPLEPRHFFAMSHQVLFNGMRDLYRQGKPIDRHTLRALLGDDYERVVDGDRYFLALTNGMPRGVNVRHYADVVREQWAAREAVKVLRKADAELCHKPSNIRNGGVRLHLEQIEHLIAEVDESGREGGTGLTMEWPAPMGRSAFSGLAGEYVDLVASDSEADPALLLTNFLAYAGSALGGKPHYLVQSERHGLNEFVVAVGQSSKARKGHSLAPIDYLFSRADPDWFAGCIAQGLSSGEGLIFAVRDGDESGKPGTDRGVVDKRKLVIETEFSRVLKNGGRQGNNLSEQLRLAWNAKHTLGSMTRANPMQATGAHISLIGHITIEELRRVLTETDRANGFGNRILWVAARRAGIIARPRPFREDIMRPYVETLRDRLASGRRVDCIDLSLEAEEWWAAPGGLYEELSSEGDGSGIVAALSGRAEAHVIRLAAIYAVLDGASAILKEHLAAAHEVWQYCARSIRYIFGTMTGDEMADRLLSYIKSATDGRARSDLSHFLGKNIAAQRLEVALGVLMKMKLAHCVRRPGTGRHPEVWFAGVAPAAVRSVA